MGTDEEAFGWMRYFTLENIGSTELIIDGFKDKTFTISWFDTWTGKKIESTKQRSLNGKLKLKVPLIPTPHPDIAFKIYEN